MRILDTKGYRIMNFIEIHPEEMEQTSRLVVSL